MSDICYNVIHMMRTQIYLTKEQTQDIKLRSKRENKAEAEVIRELLDIGRTVSPNTAHESTGDALLRLAKLGERLHIKAPADLSTRIDDYLYGDE
jgi:hypothetical protein